MNSKAARMPPMVMPLALRLLAAPPAGGASVVEAAGLPEEVSDPLTGETSLLEAGDEVVPEAEPVLVMRVVDAVTGLASLLDAGEVAGGAALLEPAGLAPVSTEVEVVVEAAEAVLSTVVVVEASEVGVMLEASGVLAGMAAHSVGVTVDMTVTVTSAAVRAAAPKAMAKAE